MIKRVLSNTRLEKLPKRGIEAQKIRALMLSYGVNYDFCRFYISDNLFIGEQNGQFIICETAPLDYTELAEFLSFSGFSEIFCSKEVGRELAKRLSGCYSDINLMRLKTPVENNLSEINKTPTLDEVFGIVSSAFPIEWEPWYLDMSHRIRHGISAARVYESSALVIQHNLNGEALLSQIATIPEKRGRGYASRLIESVCAELSDSDIFILCEDLLAEFYSKLGFEIIDKKAIVKRS